VTIREEHRLKVFENRVLRRIFGPKSEEVIGGWRKLHNEELRDLYSSPVVNGVMCFFKFCDCCCFHFSNKFFMYFCAFFYITENVD
jgi:hypothetical protein